MKDKILMLIIGILIGAIITSACFLLFGKSNKNPGDRMNKGNFDANMIGGGRMERPTEMDRNSMGEPPAIPEETSATDTSSDA